MTITADHLVTTATRLASSTRRPVGRVVVAGGGVLGTDTLKALAHSGRYEPIAVDVSPLAYFVYQDEAAASHLLDESNYIEDLIACCWRANAPVVIPAAEPTLKLISAGQNRLADVGITAVLNRPGVISTCSDKSTTFKVLQRIGVPIPHTRTLVDEDHLVDLPLPCVIKPATDTGGSVMVSVAETPAEARMYAHWIWSAGLTPVAQEYLPLDEGEFTVGVLRFDGWTGAIAMRREFPAKLSYVLKTDRFLISSGFSQGLIDEFPGVCEQATAIADALDSYGPINIQGRVVNGTFYPFEINPRFSGTTYLRTMAGFPEIDIFLDHLHGFAPPPHPVITPGYYLRTFTERFVPPAQLLRRP